jgi:hypothetical protein
MRLQVLASETVVHVEARMGCVKATAGDGHYSHTGRVEKVGQCETAVEEEAWVIVMA